MQTTDYVAIAGIAVAIASVLIDFAIQAIKAKRKLKSNPYRS